MKIDPTVTVPTESLIEVTTSTVHGTYQGEGYGYAGYITSKMTGVPGKRYRAQPHVLRRQLRLCRQHSERGPDRQCHAGCLPVCTVSPDQCHLCLLPINAWKAGSLTWDSSVVLPLEPSGENCTSGAKHGMHHFDIRETVNNWVQGTAPNYGLVVMATDESAYGGAFYTPLPTGTEGQSDFSWDKRPGITIHWSVPDPVDENYGVDDTTVNLRSMILTDRNGKLQFQGVFADGTAAPGSIVGYTLNDPAKITPEPPMQDTPTSTRTAPDLTAPLKKRNHNIQRQTGKLADPVSLHRPGLQRPLPDQSTGGKRRGRQEKKTPAKTLSSTK